MRRYAQDTSVAVSKSRGEIDKLLRNWSAKGIQWSDDFEHDLVSLRFIWVFEGIDYMARFSIALPSHGELNKEAYDRRTGQFSKRKMDRLMDMRGRAEHRLLLLWFKAAVNAVAAGIVSAETIFLPFMEGKDGQTVAEIAIPRLSKLMSGSATRLLAGKVEE